MTTIQAERDGFRPSPTPIQMCEANGCGFVRINGGLCGRHIRALRLTTRVQDALMDYFNTRDVLRPVSRSDRDIMLAGEHITEGLRLLINQLFGDVFFDENPIFADIDERLTRRPRWRVSLAWQLSDDSCVDIDDDGQLGNDDEAV
ncbi:hypothetical protein JF710_21210 [Mycobacterium intracellulare]|uniref:hypothetical protein n=1 Tax=Mycobacterium intracellulare TaxID=1767 RepID=UPI001CDB2575|nr:hypothetical protein [Mycobacterium intracellulare]MCA2255701.1 hypothetical protein [Mycobacterium intracellulare]